MIVPRMAAAVGLLAFGCNTILGTSDVTGPLDTDGGVDAASQPPEGAQLRAPALGAATGSVHASASRRPRFSWHPTPGATRYEFQLDDSCAISSFRTCEFPSPELIVNDAGGTEYAVATDLVVAMSPPVGRRYYWRVRACNAIACGAFSEVWYLDVGRLRDDVNGDGFGDVIVGITSGAAEPATIGRGHIILGQSGLGSATIVELPDPRSESDAHFGAAVAMVGDLNADGYADVAVGAWRSPHASHLGWVYIYAGRGTWPSTVNSESGGYGLATPDAAEHFGSAIAGGGDVNGDGYADFTVTALEPVLVTARPGYVYMNYGRPVLPAAQLGSDRVIPDPTGATAGLFGWSLSMADVNQDGFADAVVGAIGRDALVGNAVMYFGGRDTTAPPINVASHDVRFAPAAAAPSAFGYASTTCSANGQVSAVAIGSPLESAPGQAAGRLRLFRGRAPWPEDISIPDATIDDPSGAFRASMGTDLACADVTSDGRSDLVASAPTPDDDGVVFLFDDVSSLPAAPLATLSAGTGVVGHQVKVTDFNGDGVTDIVVSRLRGSATPAGAVLVWFGRQTWPSTITSADLTIPNPSAVAGEQFGVSLD